MPTPALPTRPRRPPELLDARERALIRFAAEGLTVAEIGQLLGLHPIAVRCLVREMRRALADPLARDRSDRSSS
jgi:DNA-binding NarL/FixJ family response regulator